jgi:hypothetical protein
MPSLFLPFGEENLPTLIPSLNGLSQWFFFFVILTFQLGNIFHELQLAEHRLQLN